MNHERSLRRQRQRRRYRVRKRCNGTSERPRLSVFRSHKHIYAQVIDDLSGRTIVSASSADSDVGKKIKYGGNCDAAAAVGKAIAEQAKAAGIQQVAFDRGHFHYHGRVAALAESAREAGLKL